MQATAKLNYLHMAPRKVRLVADMIRKKSVKEAEKILNFIPQRAALPMIKLIKSAVSNAKNSFGSEESNLFISKITVDEGPKMKKWMPRARGSPSLIHKKTSHIFLILDEIEKGKAKINKEEEVPAGKDDEGEGKITKNVQKPKISRSGAETKKPRLMKMARRIFGRKSFSK